eukprot:361618-Chlamydomonas_euryale.AAC.2
MRGLHWMPCEIAHFATPASQPHTHTYTAQLACTSSPAPWADTRTVQPAALATALCEGGTAASACSRPGRAYGRRTEAKRAVAGRGRRRPRLRWHRGQKTKSCAMSR